MLTVENVETYGWEAAIRGMRNPMNSWEKSDSWFIDEYRDNGAAIDAHQIASRWKNQDLIKDPNLRDHVMETVGYAHRHSTTDGVFVGPNDQQLMLSLAKGGPVHAKFRRMLTITMDITAPLYWWKEFDTYKVGTVANSCSTMHKIADKPFELDDFSCDQLLNTGLSLFTAYSSDGLFERDVQPLHFVIDYIIPALNTCREKYLETKDKRYWWQLIQLLPSSYNQKRTVQLNYEVAHNIYISRKDHKLDCWRTLYDELAKLPMSELIVEA